MNPEFWHQRWKTREISFHQQEINHHLKKHWHRLNLKPQSKVFVPLCGKSLDLLWLLGEGHSVVGVELSSIAVEAFFNENDLNPTVTETDHFHLWQCEELTIYCGDLFNLPPEALADVDALFDRASLVALPPEMRRRYVDFLMTHLHPSAAILLVSMEYDESERTGPPFNVTEEEVRALYRKAHQVERLETFDLLGANPEFKARGLTRFDEKIYQISLK